MAVSSKNRKAKQRLAERAAFEYKWRRSGARWFEYHPYGSKSRYTIHFKPRPAPVALPEQPAWRRYATRFGAVFPYVPVLDAYGTRIASRRIVRSRSLWQTHLSKEAYRFSLRYKRRRRPDLDL